MEIVREYWAMILSALGLVAWALRAEFATKANASEIRRLWKQRDEDLRAHKEARDTTNEMLKEVRSDIKKLLQRKGE